MRIAVGSDHGGFEAKKKVLKIIDKMGHEYLDFGTHSEESVDFPDYARDVGTSVSSGQSIKGILLCGSGVGMSIAANKMDGIYAAVCHDVYSAAQGVQHNDMNVLCVGGRVVDDYTLDELVKAFVEAEFHPKERYLRRVEKIHDLEEGD